jgi:bifunctional non-homologous end joining protein LigD
MAAQPDFIPPMLASAAAEPFSDPAWLFELKWDGYRVEAVVRDGRVRLWTRNHKDAAGYFPDLAGPPDWLAAGEAILDGEVVALDEAGRPRFSLLQERTGLRRFEAGRGAAGAAAAHGRGGSAVGGAPAPLAYQVFDLLWLDGHSLLDEPLEARKARLREVLRDHPLVRYAAHIEAEGVPFFEAAATQGLEGIVAKRRASRYEPGRRSRAWLKLKARREQEFVVGGWEPGEGAARELGALLLGVHENGALRFVGEVGSGFSDATRRDLASRLASLRRDHASFADPPATRTARWVEPRLVVRVEFSDWTHDGLARQAVYKGLEIGKDPSEVVREPEPALARSQAARREHALQAAPSPPVRPASPAVQKVTPALPARTSPAAPRTPPSPAGREQPVESATAQELAALDELGNAGTWSVGGHEVALTNLDKVLFPEVGLTKRDLVRYYVGVAPVLLPYLRDRGLSLDRWPDGPGGIHFWHKEIPAHAPAWLERWHYESPEPDQSHTYVVADRAAALAFLANQAAIDLHPWTSRRDVPERPTYALIDIDPGRLTTFEEVLVMARLYRTALAHLGVRGYPKLTGKRGLQVWVPVEPRYGFRETAAWVEQLSRAVGAQVPELVSWAWSVAERRGKARLDYTQNAINKTLVAPYAVRPLPEAPVSAPITWEELDDPELRPGRWTLTSMPARLAERGDLFAGALRYDQVLPPLS